MTAVAAPATPAPEAVADLSRALADPTRVSLLATIWRGERCVCDLQVAAGDRPQNLVSHHLAVLRRAGLVDTRRAGRWIYYRPADHLDPVVAEVLGLLLGPRPATDGGCCP